MIVVVVVVVALATDPEGSRTPRRVNGLGLSENRSITKHQKLFYAGINDAE